MDFLRKKSAGSSATAAAHGISGDISRDGSLGARKAPLSILLCLCIIAICLSLPLNGLSPSLSLIAKDMKFNDADRNKYLGGYVALTTMIGQLIGSTLAGFIVDRYNRKNIIIYLMNLGTMSTALFGMILSYPVLLILRVSTGFCQGAIVPIIFSLIGDFYSSEERALNSSIVSSCLGGGMMIGQIFVGFVLPLSGWRVPFILMGAFTFFITILLRMYLYEPLRGGAEAGMSTVYEKGLSLPSLSVKTFLESLSSPTVLLMIAQTVPNTIPWGILSTHLHDVIATDSKLSIETATSLMAIFGIGAAAGGLVGGYIGAKIYSSSRVLLPIFMGLTISVSALLIRELLSMNLTIPGMIQIAYPTLVMSGVLAAVNGANIRFIILNITLPEARGAVIAVLNIVNCVGRGIGPSLLEIYMSSYGGNRKYSISLFLNLWLLSGTLLCVSSVTLGRDEDHVKNSIRKIVDGMSGLDSVLRKV